MPWGRGRDGASPPASHWALTILHPGAEVGQAPVYFPPRRRVPPPVESHPRQHGGFSFSFPALRPSSCAPGAGDLTGDPLGYVTGVLAVLVHAAYLVLIQKASADTQHGPLTAQYAIAISATPLLVVLSFASTDAIQVWAFPGWKDPTMVCIFVACVLIGCAMNFTTLHCTYINSAVTTSFVGVVKSIATITVGMVAFSDVAPTSLFIAGVVVNTLGSIIYCVAKFLETRKQSNYEDLETQPQGEAAQPGGDQLPFVIEELPEEVAGGAEGGKVAGGSAQQRGQGVRGSPRGVPLAASAWQMADSAEDASRRSLKDAYLVVWRLVRGTKYVKKDYLIENEESPSP
ncbi:PREDICTED: solute carrier family 35 member D3 [Myotis davidii]|uniref:solute carrier family 35 member D3 n=1 Tax=Myotis davidii TaxID=225400 RepID=UPI0003EC18D2|nr:PREDICTED: solute carrier family 35 member D3 [Myotis davidii]